MRQKTYDNVQAPATRATTPCFQRSHAARMRLDTGQAYAIESFARRREDRQRPFFATGGLYRPESASV